MAFKLAQSPTFKTPVKVDTPKSGGGFEASEFTAVFKRCTTEEIEQLTARNDDGTSKMTTKEQVQLFMVGFERLLDDDDAEVVFSEDSFAALLSIPQALLGIQNAFWNTVYKASK